MRLLALFLIALSLGLAAWQCVHYLSRGMYWETVHNNFASDEGRNTVSAYHTGKIAEVQNDIDGAGLKILGLVLLSTAGSVLWMIGEPKRR